MTPLKRKLIFQTSILGVPNVSFQGSSWISTHGMLQALDALRVIHYQSPLPGVKAPLGDTSHTSGSGLVFGGEGMGYG